jgi:hypothetical protein
MKLWFQAINFMANLTYSSAILVMLAEVAYVGITWGRSPALGSPG